MIFPCRVPFLFFLTNALISVFNNGESLRMAQAILPFSPEPNFRMKGNVIKNLCPEFTLVAVDYNHRYQTGINHFKQILILQVLIGLHYFYWRFSFFRQLFVKTYQAFIITTRFPDMDCLVAQIG